MQQQVNYSSIYNAFYLTFLLAFFVWVISQGKYVVHKELCVGVCVCMDICLRAAPAWKILEGRLETKIGKDIEITQLLSLLSQLFTEMQMIFFFNDF